jgi:gas vesicle protein
MKTAKNGVESAKDHAEHALGTAKNVMESAKEGTEHTFTSVMSTVLKGASAVTGFVAMVRSLDLDDGLSWFGLARRRRPLHTLAAFGAGVAVGAGVGVLFAPMSGAALRRAILGEAKDLEREAKHTLEKVETEVKEGVDKGMDKAEALAGKAKDGVKKVEHKVGEAADAVKGAVMGNTVDETKSSLSHANLGSAHRPS